MKPNKKKVILYFIKGSSPSPEDLAGAEKLGTTKFRNALVGLDENPEPCDMVAGAVPKAYDKVKRAVPQAPKEPIKVPEGDVPNPWDPEKK